jgi:hypothetical protein
MKTEFEKAKNEFVTMIQTRVGLPTSEKVRIINDFYDVLILHNKKIHEQYIKAIDDYGNNQKNTNR